ncbi:MAG: hypothetical protein ABSD74_15140 [Rhizomicrobium sp.]|jgi:hypothetical protein
MLKAFGLGLFVLAATAGSAWADNMCGDEPIAPLIPTVSEMKLKTPTEAATSRHTAFLEVKKWQSDLQSYRNCLGAAQTADKRKIGEIQRSDKPDKDKIAGVQQDLTALGAAYDSSVDEEERIVNDFHAALVAYCVRPDVDRSACPKT